jgi:hypothetical protein
MRKEISFAYIKSEGIGTECEEEVYKLIDDQGLDILWVTDVFMHYMELRAHQPILFDLKGDLDDIWKIQGAARMIGKPVRTLTMLGEDAISRTFDIKTQIRREYALPCEFDRTHEISYPNYMHAADNLAQVENDVRVLLPDRLVFLRSINGEHPIEEAIW